MSYPRNVPPSRAVALDLMLRTCLNSSEFLSSNPKNWENIAKLVPGTTPQQCCQRWEELRCHSTSVVGDYSGLTAQGRPFSTPNHTHHRQMAKFVRSMLYQPPTNTSSPSSSSSSSSSSQAANALRMERSQSQAETVHRRIEREREKEREREREREKEREREVLQRGKFVANFYQAMLNKEWEEKREEEVDGRRLRGRSKEVVEEVREGRREGGGQERGSEGKKEVREGRSEEAMREERREEVRERRREEERKRRVEEDISKERKHKENTQHMDRSTNSSLSGPNMVIHVFDEPRKMKRDFFCPRDLLVREMKYFSEYLSSDTQLWDEVDISVHCDVPVFEWLMRYAKRGMQEGPCGERLAEPLEPPSLEPGNVVSILISSDFLKMDSLVEECLQFCHDHISAVVASPTNMSCISEGMRRRLAAKFTPMEVEKIVDRRDKIRSKLFIHQIQGLLSPSHSTPECPASAATLHRCSHCGKLLTAEQRDVMPCISSRMAVHQGGSLVYNHEPDPTWNLSTYLLSLQQQERLSARYIYWRLWGHINWLWCSLCHQPFQCCELSSCAYHPQPAVSGRPSTGPPVHICCGHPPNFSPFPHPQNGCCFKDHTITIPTDTPPPSPSTSIVYDLLLSLRDVIMFSDKADKQSRAKRKDSSSGPLSPNSVQLCLLRNEDRTGTRMVSLNSAQAVSADEPAQQVKGGETGVRSDTAVTRQQHPVSVDTARHASHDSSEMEEDEDEANGTAAATTLPVPAAHGGLKQRRESKTVIYGNSTRRRHSHMDVQSAPLLPVEWIWDSNKSRRWNQDRQRETDEWRLSSLSGQLSQLGAAKSPPVAEGGGTRGKEKERESYAGGIFGRLEAQFRVQQMTKGLSHQHPHGMGSRSQGSGRKR